MPLYEYVCECGHRLAVTHTITEDPEIECSDCKGIMKRSFGNPSVSFKGSGFYSTEKDKK